MIGGRGGGGGIDAETFILQNNNDDLFEPRWLHFKKDMKEYLFDCPILVEKIDNKTYNIDDIDVIVRDYNKSK